MDYKEVSQKINDLIQSETDWLRQSTGEPKTDLDIRCEQSFIIGFLKGKLTSIIIQNDIKL